MDDAELEAEITKKWGGVNKAGVRGGLWWLAALLSALWLSGASEARAGTRVGPGIVYKSIQASSVNVRVGDTVELYTWTGDTGQSGSLYIYDYDEVTGVSGNAVYLNREADELTAVWSKDGGAWSSGTTSDLYQQWRATAEGTFTITCKVADADKFGPGGNDADVTHTVTITVGSTNPPPPVPTATPGPTPTATPRPTPTATPGPTATPRPTATPTPVPVFGSMTLSTNKEEICAGGLGSPVHQATLTATILDTQGRPMANRSVRFSWDTPGPSAPVAGLRSTDAYGRAFVVVTSGDEPGTFVTRADYDRHTRFKYLRAGVPQGAVGLTPKEVEADGTSRFTLTLPLTYNGYAVPGHQVVWRLTAVVGENGPVLPDASGNYSGYGQFVGSTSSTTDSHGVATKYFVVGTKAASYTFEAQDYTVFLPAGSALQGGQSATQSISLLASATGQRPHPNFERGDGNSKNQPTLVLLRDGKPLTDAQILVGQYMNLKVEVRNGPTPSVVQWSIGGLIKAKFQPFLQQRTGDYPGFNEEVNIGEAVDVVPAAKTFASVRFFWVDGGQQTITCTAQVAGKRISKSVTLDVLRPEVTQFLTTHTTSVQVLSKPDVAGPILSFGNTSSLSTVGISFNKKGLGSGTIGGTGGFLQIASAGRRGFVPGYLNGGLWWRQPGGTGVDAHPNQWMYSLDPSSTNDTPSNSMGGLTLEGAGSNGYTTNQLQIDEHFVMYYMYRPSGSDVAWVPLAKVAWSWKGTLDNRGSTLKKLGFGNSPDPKWVRTTEYPFWTHRINTELPWVKDPNQNP